MRSSRKEYIIRMAQIASGRVLFMSIDVFKAKSFPSIARYDLLLRTKMLHYPIKIHDTPSCCLWLFFPSA